MPGILEEKSLWYKYKTEIWPQKSAQSITIHNTMRVLRSITNIGNLRYMSVPITSGWFYYNLLLEYSPPEREEKKSQLMRAAIRHNYRLAWNFWQALMKHWQRPVVNPAFLIPKDQRWGQDHFQALWLSIISEMCSDHDMHEKWEYSNGGAEEFTHTYQLKLGIPKCDCLDSPFYNTKETEERARERMRTIDVYDHQGRLLSLNRGYQKIEKAIPWIEERGFAADRLRHCLQLLEWTGNMIAKGFYQ
ncbi:MAG: hypothetical protein V1867_02810 [Candidatus Falkowbacteria bacterium]